MDEEYETKETARMALRDALEKYKEAAEAFGLDDSGMADEIETALSDVGLSSMEVVC